MTTVDECIYCRAEVHDPDPVPDVDDDEAWAAIASDHEHDCEWVLTRAHRIEHA